MAGQLADRPVASSSLSLLGRPCVYALKVEVARLAVAGLPLGERVGDELHVDLRWRYVHIIDEYGGRNGDADLIRELIDGTTSY